jgi:hypothetical protein
VCVCAYVLIVVRGLWFRLEYENKLKFSSGDYIVCMERRIPKSVTL